MSTYFYLADKKNKIKMTAGKADKDQFLEAAEAVEDKFLPLTYFEGSEKLYNLDMTKLKDICIEDIRELLKLIEAIQSFDSMSTIYFWALFYYIEMIKGRGEYDYYCEYNEEKVKEYKDYKYIEEVF